MSCVRRMALQASTYVHIHTFPLSSIHTFCLADPLGSPHPYQTPPSSKTPADDSVFALGASGGSPPPPSPASSPTVLAPLRLAVPLLAKACAMDLKRALTAARVAEQVWGMCGHGREGWIGRCSMKYCRPPCCLHAVTPWNPRFGISFCLLPLSLSPANFQTTSNLYGNIPVPCCSHHTTPLFWLQADAAAGMLRDARRGVSAINTLAAMLRPRVAEGQPDSDLAQGIAVQVGGKGE